jgi:hypothetical protein
MTAWNATTSFAHFGAVRHHRYWSWAANGPQGPVFTFWDHLWYHDHTIYFWGPRTLGEDWSRNEVHDLLDIALRDHGGLVHAVEIYARNPNQPFAKTQSVREWRPASYKVKVARIAGDRGYIGRTCDSKCP